MEFKYIQEGDIYNKKTTWNGNQTKKREKTNKMKRYIYNKDIYRKITI